MTRGAQENIGDRAPSARLADVAHELSSAHDWNARLKNALAILCDIVPSDHAALAIQFQEWKTFIFPGPSDPYSLRLLLVHHFLLMTGELPPGLDDERFHAKLTGATSDGGNFLSLPVVAADRVIGVLYIRRSAPRAYTCDDACILSVVATMIGAYVAHLNMRVEENVARLEIEHLRKEAERKADEAHRAYLRERHISDVLQRTLMPPVSLDLPGFEIVGRFQSAFEESDVGGDFYDAFPAPDGKLVLMIGDVAGKGLGAAVYTAMAKYMIRGYAHENPTPASVLSRVNNVLCQLIPDDIFITLIYGLLDPAARVFNYANAGHEPPILYSARIGPTFESRPTGPALGMIPEASYTERTLPLLPGDVMVAFTDGISEARTGTDLFGAERIASVVTASARTPAHDIIDFIFEAAIRHAEGDLRDDAAVLIVKANPEHVTTK